jgi:hypothetical protein
MIIKPEKSSGLKTPEKSPPANKRSQSHKNMFNLFATKSEKPQRRFDSEFNILNVRGLPSSNFNLATQYQDIV